MHPFFLNNTGSLTELETGTHWPREELRRQILIRASRYTQAGICPDDTVVILHKNNTLFFADLLSLWMIGACVCCLDDGIGVAEFQTIIGELGARFVIVRGGLPEKLQAQALSVTALDSQSDADAEPVLVYGNRSVDAPSLILYTSGSTGLPKGVVHSMRSLQAKWFALEKQISSDICRNTLCLLPTNFGHGLICNALYPLLSGQHVVLAANADMSTLSNLGKHIDTHKISFLSSVPAIWRMALRLSKPPQKTSLRRVHIGSAPLGVALWQQVKKWVGQAEAWNTYGITETGSWIAGGKIEESNLPEEGLVGSGWDAEFCVTGSSENGLEAEPGAKPAPVLEPLPVNTVGDVWVRTPALMLHYFDRPDETEKVTQGEWFRTGDLGRINTRGQLVLTGRTRNEINKGGTKISPEEIDLLLENHPLIDEACAFAFADKVFGENIGVCLVLASNQTAPSRDALKEWCQAHMSDHKIPARWYHVEEIPKTPRGKVKRPDVATYCATQTPL